MLLPEDYTLAREIYAMCLALPLGHTLSRQEINRALRAESNDKKNERISRIIRNMLWCGQIQKRMHRDSCQVVFWVHGERGEQIKPPSQGEWVINYLIDPPKEAPPPPPPPPPPPEVEPEPAKVVPPPSPKTLRQLIDEFFFRRESCTMRVLQAQFPTQKQAVMEIVESMWREGELCRDSTSSMNNVFLWLPTAKCAYVNDTIREDVPDETEDTEYYMMRDLKSKKKRILLRPTGDTLSLTIDEIEFIQSLKKPYVTL